MPRAADGTYTLAPVNPVVVGQPIRATWANPSLTDIADALTYSLDRQGKGPMLAPLTLLNSTPASALHATSKGYVDTALTGYLPVNGTAVAASKLAPGRTINGVLFDGTTNITVAPGEAPSDGKQYARKSAAWAEIVIPPSGIPEAPIDGSQYARQNAAWAMVSIPTGLGSLAYNNFTVDDTAPAVPKVGDRWVRPATGDEMVRVPTGDGAGAWIDPGASQIPLPLAVASGGTAATTAVQAKTNLGLGNVDNTSDANKPVSTATATALAGKQASLGFTPVQQGGGIGQLTNTVKIGWSAGAQLKATVDTTDLGNLLFGNQFVASLGNVGYQKFPTGLIIQWGTSVVTTDAGGAAAISYPIAFPNAIFVAVVANGDHAQGNLLIQSYTVGWPTTSGHAIYARIANTGAIFPNTPVRINWVAFGN